MPYWEVKCFVPLDPKSYGRRRTRQEWLSHKEKRNKIVVDVVSSFDKFADASDAVRGHNHGHEFVFNHGR